MRVTLSVTKDGTPDGGDAHELQFDWLPEAFSSNQRTCQHRTYFASEMIAIADERKSSPETVQNNHMDETKTETLESPMKKRRMDVGSPADIIVIYRFITALPDGSLPGHHRGKGDRISEIERSGAEDSVGGQTAPTEVASLGGQEDA